MKNRSLTSYAYIDCLNHKIAYECKTSDGFCNWIPFNLKLKQITNLKKILYRK